MAFLCIFCVSCCLVLIVRAQPEADDNSTCGSQVCDMRTEYCDRTLVVRCLPCDRLCNPAMIGNDLILKTTCEKYCPVYVQMRGMKQTPQRTATQPSTGTAPTKSTDTICVGEKWSFITLSLAFIFLIIVSSLVSWFAGRHCTQTRGSRLHHLPEKPDPEHFPGLESRFKQDVKLAGMPMLNI